MRFTKTRLASLSVAVTLAALLFSAGRAAGQELQFTAGELWQRALTRNVYLGDNGQTLELQRGTLIEDDGPAAGYSYRPNEEQLRDEVRIRKTLLLEDPRASAATLLVGPGGTLQGEINGQPADLRDSARAGNYWQAYRISPELLRQGQNNIVLYGKGKVWVAREEDFARGSRTRTRHPNRSAKSTDGGKTWQDSHLGTEGNLDGEYYVRLFLDQFRSQGSVTLPVLDATNLAGGPLGPPVKTLDSIRIAVDARQLDPGEVLVHARTGPDPQPNSERWSRWRTLKPGGELREPAGRFVQFRVELLTSDPLRSPQLEGVRITARPKLAKDWTQTVRVSQFENAHIVRSSIPFEYEPFDHPELRRLREKYRLDDVVQGADSEFETICRLAAWSAGQWKKGHLKDIYPAWNALEILKPHADGTPVGGFCQQYNLVLLQACESFGIPGRAVSLGRGDHGAKIRSGHEVVELWSNEFRKWVHVDGNHAWYFADRKTNVPLSLWELRQRQLSVFHGEDPRPVKLVQLAETGVTWQGFEQKPPFFELRLIPRSNFLQQSAPLPLNQGMRGWFWTGHHAWTDEAYPASLLYGRRVCHERNWHWTLNQAQLTLEATARERQLRVHLDTHTPGFKTFVARIDGQPPRPVTSGFVWELHPGANRLAVWPRNSAGRDGIPSHVVLDAR